MKIRHLSAFASSPVSCGKDSSTVFVNMQITLKGKVTVLLQNFYNYNGWYLLVTIWPAVSLAFSDTFVATSDHPIVKQLAPRLWTAKYRSDKIYNW